jgi:pyruvate dehydrogenase E1 component beta subunit
MPIKVLMPALSPTMTEGKLSKWLKKEGDKIKSGDVIAEIETDKATIEYEATESGVLGKIIIKDGSEGIKVNELIGVLLDEGESVADIEKFLSTNIATVNQSIPTKKEENHQSNLSVAVQPAFVSVNNSVESEYANSPKKTLTVREALREAMSEEMRKDKDVFLMGEEVAEYQGAYKVSQGMLQEFGPSRVIDVPIAEYGFTGLASGAAFSGLKPIVEYMTFNFSLQAIDHIINSSAKTLYMSGGKVNSPIVFRGINGAGTRTGAQHSQCLASWYAHVPGLIVLAPYSSEDAKGLLKSAIRNPNPVVFLEQEVLYGKSFELPDVEDLTIPIGKAKIEKSGTQVSIVAYSYGMHPAMLAAAELEQEGISVEVVNLRSLRPLDTETIVNSIKKTNRLVTVEEGWAYAGIGAEIATIVMEQAFDYLDAPVVRVCGKDVPMPYAANLEKATLPTAADVKEAVKKVLNLK